MNSHSLGLAPISFFGRFPRRTVPILSVLGASLLLTGCFREVVPASFDQLRSGRSPDANGILWFVGRGTALQGLKLGMQPLPVTSLDIQGYRVSRLTLNVIVENKTDSTLALSPEQFSLTNSKDGNVPQCKESGARITRLEILPGDERTFQVTFECEGMRPNAGGSTVELAWCYELDDNLYHRTTELKVEVESQ